MTHAPSSLPLPLAGFPDLPHEPTAEAEGRQEDQVVGRQVDLQIRRSTPDNRGARDDLVLAKATAQLSVVRITATASSRRSGIMLTSGEAAWTMPVTCTR